MAFNISDFLNEESRKETKNTWKVVKVNIHKLQPAEDKNFYHIEDEEVKLLAKTIELVGLQQYPVIRQIEGTDNYEIISGHKRRMALLSLVKEGKAEYEMVPCKIETSDAIKNELALIFTNSTQRERTDYEKMQEIKRVKELLTEYQKTHNLHGKKQNIIAEILGMSKTKVGMLDKIDKKLIEPFKKELATGKLNTTTADKIASLKVEEQKEEYATYKEKGDISAKAKEIKKKVSKQKEVLKADKEQQRTSYYGLTKSVYPEKSLVSTEGCGNQHNCFSCGMVCQIRQKERYCRTAPLGNPFSCTQVGNKKLKHTIYQNECMHLHPELAPLTEGSKEPEPCCLLCKEKDCSAICNIAKKRQEESCEKEDIQVTELNFHYDYLDIKWCLEKWEENLKAYKKLDCPETTIKEQQILVDALRLLVKQWEGKDGEEKKI